VKLKALREMSLDELRSAPAMTCEQITEADVIDELVRRLTEARRAKRNGWPVWKQP